MRRIARQHKNAPENFAAASRQAALKYPGDTPLWFIISAIYDKVEIVDIESRAHSPQWMIRLSAVLAIGNGETRITSRRREILHLLASDGSRLVRAAAKTVLENSDFRFAW